MTDVEENRLRSVMDSKSILPPLLRLQWLLLLRAAWEEAQR